MKHKFYLFIYALVLTLSLGSFEEVFACSCLQQTSCQAYNNADVIFVGKVVGSKEQKTIEDYSENNQNSNTSTSAKPKTINYDVGEIYFEVQESFLASEKGSRITIHSGTGGGDCGFWFKRGETYLVYARKEESDSPLAVSSLTYGGTSEKLEPTANRLWTSICSHTAHIGQAKEDLDYLQNISADKTEGIIFGELNEILSYRKDDETKPFGTIKIKFHLVGSEEKFYETVTDINGKYEIKIPSGRYKIIPVLPEYAQVRELGSERNEIEIKPNGCATANFIIESKSKISGKLISVEGKPVVDSTIELTILTRKNGRQVLRRMQKEIFRSKEFRQENI